MVLDKENKSGVSIPDNSDGDIVKPEVTRRVLTNVQEKQVWWNRSPMGCSSVMCGPVLAIIVEAITTWFANSLTSE
jgi:hypothetical protein